jgi:hypothetical protein
MAGVTDQPPQDDPILTRFRAALAEVYGDRVERVVLYSSRAGRSPPTRRRQPPRFIDTITQLRHPA